MTISRRGFLASSVLGAAGIAVASIDTPTASALTRTAAASGSCMTLTPTQEIGPFYVDYDKVRSKITGGQAGIPLRLQDLG